MINLEIATYAQSGWFWSIRFHDGGCLMLTGEGEILLRGRKL